MNDVREDVDAGEIERPERGALRPSERRAGDRVDLLDRVGAGLDLLEDLHHAVERDVVADEVRRVLRDDDALAEVMIGEIRDTRRRRPGWSRQSGSARAGADSAAG